MKIKIWYVVPICAALVVLMAAVTVLCIKTQETVRTLECNRGTAVQLVVDVPLDGPIRAMSDNPSRQTEVQVTGTAKSPGINFFILHRSVDGARIDDEVYADSLPLGDSLEGEVDITISSAVALDPAPRGVRIDRVTLCMGKPFRVHLPVPGPPATEV